MAVGACGASSRRTAMAATKRSAPATTTPPTVRYGFTPVSLVSGLSGSGAGWVQLRPARQHHPGDDYYVSSLNATGTSWGQFEKSGGTHGMSIKPVESLDSVVIRFAGDSGDGMQLTGDRFTSETAALGNDLSTLP